MKKTLLSFFLIIGTMTAFAESLGGAFDEVDLTDSDDSAISAQRLAQVQPTVNPGVVNISCDDAMISDVLRQFRKITRANIISPDSTNLARRVSVELNSVPWLEALKSILESRGFRIEVRNNIYYVQESINKEVTRSYELKHASAEELADLFNGYALKSEKLVDKSGKTEEAVKSVESQFSALGGKVKASSFPNANILVLTGLEADLMECEKIIDAIDHATKQVYIEARFLELSSSASHQFGMKWDSMAKVGLTSSGNTIGLNSGKSRSEDNNRTGERTTSSSWNRTDSSEGSSSSGSSSAASTDGNSSSANLADSIANSFSESLTSAFSNNSTHNDSVSKNQNGAYTYSGTLTATDFSLFLSAFEEVGGSQIFSNPKVIVSNGKEAVIDMTTKFPNLKITSQRNTASGQTYTDYTAQLEEIRGDKETGLFAGSAFFSWGISLSVKPRISPEGLISVAITPTISDLEDYYRVQGGSSGDEDKSEAAYGKYPIIKMKSIKTDFTMNDGCTAVIGGLSRTTETDVDNGIPYLRSIPWIGPKLFGWKSREKVQSEIIICVTIGIADPLNLHKDVGLPKNAVLGREYVEGRLFEPGDRPDAAKNITKVDKRDLEDIREDPYELKDDDDAFGNDNKAKKNAKEDDTKVKIEPAKPIAANPEPIVMHIESPKPVEEPKPVAKPVEPPQPVAAPTPAPQPVVAPKPVETPKPVVVPVAAPVVQPKPVEPPKAEPKPAEPAKPAAVESAPVATPVVTPATNDEPAPARKRKARRH